MPRDLRPCGTLAAYARHLARCEPVDEECRNASQARNRALARLKQAHPDEHARFYARRRKAAAYRQLAWNRALEDLARLYPDELQTLLAEESR